MLFSELALLVKEKYPKAKVEYPLDCEIHNAELWSPTEAVPPVDILFIFSAEQLEQTQNIPLCLFCVGSIKKETYDKISQSDCNYIFLPEASSASSIYYVLSLFGNTMKQQKLYSDLLNMLLNDADLTSVFCEFSKHTKCQMLAIDISGKVIAYSKPFMIDHPHWTHSINVGYLDDYLIEYILTYREKHGLQVTPDPFLLYCDRLQMYIKCIRVMVLGETIGYIFMGNYIKDFPSFSDSFLSILAKRLRASLLERRGYSSFHMNMRKNFLTDIIDGASEEEIIQRMKVANISFPKNMRIIVFTPCYFRGSEYLYDTLFPMVSAIFPNSPIIQKKNSLVTFTEVAESGDFLAEEGNAISSLASAQKLYVSLSNTFQKPQKLAKYYQQAVQTTDFVKHVTRAGGVYFFSDFSFYLILNGMEDKDLLEQCRHPLLPLIENYDKEKNTQFYEMLKIYTQTGFSKNRTAELMFLHRNTVNYKIQQIEDLFSVDFSDPMLLFKLQYSFYIDAFLKNRYVDLPMPPSKFASE